MVPVFIEVREVNSSSHLLTKYTKVQRSILTGLKGRGGEYSIYPWVGRCSAAPHTLTLFKTNIADFPTLIKTKNDKFDTLFKTKIQKNIPWLAARPH